MHHRPTPAAQSVLAAVLSISEYPKIQNSLHFSISLLLDYELMARPNPLVTPADIIRTVKMLWRVVIS